MAAVLGRALWLIALTLAGCAGVGWSLWAFHDGHEHVLSIVAALRYLGIVAVLAALTYLVHRLILRASRETALHRTAQDTILGAVLAGPFGYALIVTVSLIIDCGTGTGC